MTRVTDETLGAYLDGELAPQERVAVERAIAADLELRRRLKSLRGADAKLREAFPLPPASPNDPIVRQISAVASLPGTAGRSLPWRTPATALAAGLAGLAVGFFAPERPSAGDALTLPASVVQVLQTRASGQTLDGARVLFSFKSDNETPCRQFASDTAAFAGEGIACRNASGWRLVAWVEGERASPEAFHAAGADDALEAVVNRLDKSGPLTDADERALLERGWR